MVDIIVGDAFNVPVEMVALMQKENGLNGLNHSARQVNFLVNLFYTTLDVPYTTFL